MLQELAFVALWFLSAVPLRMASGEVPEIRPHAEVGPWPVVSQLVAYKDRVWFANSVKGVNRNSADLYSLSMADLEIRFERSLFSQDAGDPVVAGGRLYWPLEDSRNSFGWAEVTVTDGQECVASQFPARRLFKIML